MNQELAQVGNSQPEHILGYVAELTPTKQFRVECSLCRHYIRLTLGQFFALQQSRQTYSFFVAMAGEDCQRRDPLIQFVANVLEGIRIEPDEGKAQKKMAALQAILKGASR